MSHIEKKRHLTFQKVFRKVFYALFIITCIVVGAILIWLLIKFVGGMMPKVSDLFCGDVVSPSLK